MMALAVIPAGRRFGGRDGVDGDEDKIAAGMSVAEAGGACDCEQETLDAVGGTEDSEDLTRGSCWAAGDWCSWTSESCSLRDLSDLAMEDWGITAHSGVESADWMVQRQRRFPRSVGLSVSWLSGQ